MRYGATPTTFTALSTGRSEMATAAPRKRGRPPKPPSAGDRLLADLSRPDDPYSITVMITEASRIADRLDKLAAVLSGEKSVWMSLRDGRDRVTEVRVDHSLQEARAQATTLRGLLYEIHRQRVGIEIGSEDDADDLDDLI
jgi:hypothetical protein